MNTLTFDADKKILLTLSCFGKIGPRGLTKLSRLDSFKTSGLQKLTLKDLVSVGISEEIAGELVLFVKDFDSEAEQVKLQKLGIRTVTFSDSDYPPLLREISDPPYLLYVKGSLGSLRSHSLTVVGSRRHTHYAQAVIEKVVRRLSECGVVIVSGLALGIDTLAHTMALKSGGQTVAVIGSGLDIIYPSENITLASEIVDRGGAIVSEYPLLSPPLKQHFPARNRILAGATPATLVVECDIQSGAMITAHHALDQNREVLAVPGSIVSPLSAGPNSLISLGAKPVISDKDVLETLGLVADDQPKNHQSKISLTPTEQIIFDLLSHEPVHIDSLQERSKLEMAQVNAALLFLEMKGIVRNVGAAKYVRR